MTMTRKTHRRFRKDGAYNRALEKYAEETLRACAERWNAAADLDTAVRDNVAQGLAYLVYSAYDSLACSRDLGSAADHYASSYAFISGSTAEWFRERGFAEWFCIGAGSLFNNQRPRVIHEEPVKIIRRRSAGKRRKAA